MNRRHIWQLHSSAKFWWPLTRSVQKIVKRYANNKHRNDYNNNGNDMRRWLIWMLVSFCFSFILCLSLSPIFGCARVIHSHTCSILVFPFISTRPNILLCEFFYDFFLVCVRVRAINRLATWLQSVHQFIIVAEWTLCTEEFGSFCISSIAPRYHYVWDIGIKKC